MGSNLAVYPGAFDPLHNGHIDIIERGLEIFGRMIVAILENTSKSSLFTTQERVEMLQEVLADHEGIQVMSFSGLLVKFLEEQGASVIVRGMRAVSDFDYEFQMALMNRRLYPDAETVFLTARERYTYLSSRLVKEVAMLGGEIDGLVPASVAVRVAQRIVKPLPE